MTAAYAVVALPDTIGNDKIEWQRWEQALRLSHFPPDCDSCDWQDGPRTAWGMVWQPPPRRHAERGPRQMRRYLAFRCPRCQETAVYRLWDFAEVHHLPPSARED